MLFKSSCFSILCRHFFFTAMLFVYGRILSQRLANTVTKDQFLYRLVSGLIKYHMAICYSLYIIGQSCFAILSSLWNLVFHYRQKWVVMSAYVIHLMLNLIQIAGFMWFILTLKKKMYKYQFGQYAWTHMILIVVFTQSSFTVANIFEGIFW